MAGGVLELGRPVAPVPARLGTVQEVGLQRLEGDVAFQRVAALAAERRQRRDGGRVLLGGGEPLAQHGEARARRTRPVHQLERLEAGEAGEAGMRGGSGCGVERGVQHVEHGAAGGRIRAEPGRVGTELGVHRADRERTGAVARGGAGELGETGEVADAAIAIAAQGVELHRQTPQIAVGLGIGRASVYRALAEKPEVKA